MTLSVAVQFGPQPTLVPVANEEKLRRQVRNQLYGVTRDPIIPAPDLVETNHVPAYPYNTYVVVSPNLRRIDRITHHVDTDVVVYAYHYVNTSGSTKLAVLHEGHSYFNLPNQASVITKLLNQGWNVVLVQMPQLFVVPSPPAVPDPLGAQNHTTWCLPRETSDPGYLRTFFAPYFYVKEYLKTTYAYDTFIAIGVSGGGWTVTWLGALDVEVSAIWCVGGSASWFAFFGAYDGTDYEQIARFNQGHAARPAYLLLPFENIDLYAMCADKARFLRLIYIENEVPPYIPAVGVHAQLEAGPAVADARVDGTVTVGYDTSQTADEISDFSAAIILADLLARGILPTGPGAPVAEPIPTNLIAWYRGDGMSISTMTDRSGNGNHAVQATAVNQAVLVTSDPYIKQPCLVFTAGGSGDDFYDVAAVKVGGLNPPAYTEYSFVIVCKLSTAGGQYMVINLAAASGTLGTGPYLTNFSTAGGQMHMAMNTTEAVAACHTDDWIWVVGTHTGAQRQVFINGVLAATTVSADSSPGITRIRIGRDIDNAFPAPTTGRIAEVIITGHALTQTEVTSLAPYIHSRYGL